MQHSKIFYRNIINTYCNMATMCSSHPSLIFNVRELPDMDASELLHHPAGTGTAACRSHGGVPVCAAPGVARLWSGAGGVAACPPGRDSKVRTTGTGGAAALAREIRRFEGEIMDADH